MGGLIPKQRLSRLFECSVQRPITPASAAASEIHQPVLGLAPSPSAFST
jgi:hypothetical protein